MHLIIIWEKLGNRNLIPIYLGFRVLFPLISLRGGVQLLEQILLISQSKK